MTDLKAEKFNEKRSTMASSDVTFFTVLILGNARFKTSFCVTKQLALNNIYGKQFSSNFNRYAFEYGVVINQSCANKIYQLSKHAAIVNRCDV